MFNRNYQHSWALFAVYYLLSCCVSSQSLAASRRIDDSTLSPARAAGLPRNRTVVPSRVAPNTRGVASPKNGPLLSKNQSGLQPGSAVTGQFQFPKVNGPVPYSPAGMGGPGVQPTYVRPGVAQGMNQPVPDTGMNMMQKILVWGGIAALAGGLIMKMMGGSSNSSRRPSRDSGSNDAGPSDTGSSNESAEEQQPDSRESRAAPPPEPEITPQADSPVVAQPISSPQVAEKTAVKEGEQTVAEQPSPEVRRNPSLDIPQGIMVVDSSGEYGPNLASSVPPISVASEPKGAVVTTSVAADQPKAHAVSETYNSQQKTEAASGTVSRQQSAEAASVPVEKPAVDRQKAAAKTPPKARQQPVAAAKPPLGRVCAKTVSAIRRSGLQGRLNQMVDNYIIQEGAVFTWNFGGKAFVIRAKGNLLKASYDGNNVDIDEICSEGLEITMKISYGMSIKIVRQDSGSALATVYDSSGGVYVNTSRLGRPRSVTGTQREAPQVATTSAREDRPTGQP